MAINSTRIRSLKARTLEEVETVINGLSFKVEIKSGPLPFKDTKGAGWVISFVLPEVEQLKWASVDLRD